MPAIATNTRKDRELAHKLLVVLSHQEERISITDALNACVVAIWQIANASHRPAEMVENVIAQLAQFPPLEGRALPKAVLETIARILAENGEMS